MPNNILTNFHRDILAGIVILCGHCCCFKVKGPQRLHDDVIKWKHFPRYWPFVRGIYRSLVNSPPKGKWRGTLMFSLICTRINCWVNNREAGDLRRDLTHFDVIVMDYIHLSTRQRQHQMIFVILWYLWLMIKIVVNSSSLWPIRGQSILQNNHDMLLIGLGTNFNEIGID